MLPVASLAAAYSATLRRMGGPATFVPVAGGASVDLIAGFSSVAPTDAEVVNAYGIGAKIITVLAVDLGTAPDKFDRIQMHGATYTVDTWQPVYIAGVLVSYRGFVRGPSDG